MFILHSNDHSSGRDYGITSNLMKIQLAMAVSNPLKHSIGKHWKLPEDQIKQWCAHFGRDIQSRVRNDGPFLSSFTPRNTLRGLIQGAWFDM